MIRFQKKSLQHGLFSWQEENGIKKRQHEKYFQFKKCQTWCSPSISHHPSQVNRIYLNSNDIPHQQYISNEEWTDTKSINVRYLRIVDKL